MAIFALGFAAGPVNSQALVVVDSCIYGDSAVNISVEDYDDFYIDVYNRNADSTNTVAIYDNNFAGVLMPVYSYEIGSDYNWTNAATFTIAASTKATYKITGGAFKTLKILLTTFESKTNRVDFVLRAVNKIRK